MNSYQQEQAKQLLEHELKQGQLQKSTTSSPNMRSGVDLGANT